MFRVAFCHAGAAMASYSTSWSREDEPLIPSLPERPEEPLMPSELEPRDDELLLDALRLELDEPDEALRPESSLEDEDELPFEELDDPFDEALSPPWPERSCELPRPELVLPEAPRPWLRLVLSVLLVLLEPAAL